MQPDDLHRTLRSFYAHAATLALATVDDAGLPHAANLNFVADFALDLYFVSDPRSAHARHIALRPAVAAAVYTPFDSPAQIRGVQLRGTCEPTPPDRFDELWSLFVARFPYAAAFEARARSERFYRIRPDWVRWIDNGVRFGFKLESDWPT